MDSDQERNNLKALMREGEEERKKKKKASAFKKYL